MKKLILLFAIITMAIPALASEPIAMDRQMFIERESDFQNDDWMYLGDKQFPISPTTPAQKFKLTECEKMFLELLAKEK